jgi:hypothetical protein
LTFFSSCLSTSAPPGGAWRADFKSIYGRNFGVRLLTQIVFLLLQAALVLKMAILYNFLTNENALMAQVGSKRELRP